MRFSGKERIPASRDQVWQFLTDPDAVAQCVPDVERLEVIDPSRFKAEVKAGIGPVRGKFGFDVVWQELIQPSRARMTAQGKTGGSAVTVDSTMDLTEAVEGETDLAWSADVVVHGMIASVGAAPRRVRQEADRAVLRLHPEQAERLTRGSHRDACSLVLRR